MSPGEVDDIPVVDVTVTINDPDNWRAVFTARVLSAVFWILSMALALESKTEVR